MRQYDPNDKNNDQVNESNSMSSTPYDDAFKTLQVDCKELLIPLINEVFNKEYTRSDRVTLNLDEHVLIVGDGKEKRIGDSSVSIGRDRYIFECQSIADNSMVVRMFEYIMLDSFDTNELKGNTLHVRIPQAAVLFLRSNSNTQDKMNIIVETADDKLEITVPVISIKNYSLDEIFDRKLYFLLPFYIFTYEEELEEYNNNADKLEELKCEYERITDKLLELTNRGELSYYEAETIRDIMKYVLKHIANRYYNVKEGVDAAMGGKVLEYPAKTIYNAGKSEGRLEGRLEGKVKALFYDAGYSIPEIMEKYNMSRKAVEDIINEYD